MEPAADALNGALWAGLCRARAKLGAAARRGAADACASALAVRPDDVDTIVLRVRASLGLGASVLQRAGSFNQVWSLGVLQGSGHGPTRSRPAAAVRPEGGEALALRCMLG